MDPRISVRLRPVGADQPTSADAIAASPESTTSESSAAADTISFNPDGTADGVELVLRDQQGFQLALRVNPTTARVRIVEMARQ